MRLLEKEGPLMKGGATNEGWGFFLSEHTSLNHQVKKIATNSSRL